MQTRLRKVAGALVAAALLLGLQPAAADPAEQTLLRRDQAQMETRLRTYKFTRNLERARGTNGLLHRDKQAQRLTRDRGARGRLAQFHQNSQTRSRFIGRSRTSLLRNQSFFNGRPMLSNLDRGKGRLRSHNIRGSRLFQRSPYTRTNSKFKAQRPAAPVRVAENGYVRSALNSFFAQNTIGALFIQRDPGSGKTYRLQFASAPVTRQVSPEKVAVRCSFYGSTSVDAPTVPVVVEYTLNGQGKLWNVARVQFVSVNGERLAGEFDINDADLIENTSALDEKAFPHKTL